MFLLRLRNGLLKLALDLYEDGTSKSSIRAALGRKLEIRQGLTGVMVSITLSVDAENMVVVRGWKIQEVTEVGSRGMFEKIDRPWLIPDNLDRMRYLISHLVMFDVVYGGKDKHGLLEATSSSGKTVIPIWPDENSFQVAFGNSNPAFFPRKYTKLEFERDLISTLAEDEYVAVFPNSAFDYEMFDRNEVREAIEFAARYVS